MGSWRDLAAAVAQRQEPARPVGDDCLGLPDVLAASIRRLETMPPPRGLVDDANWQDVVADAMTIARDGWAAKALALGWQTADLFGIGPRDDWEFAGLAVWLRGRSIVLLNEQRAIVADGDQHSAFERGSMGRGTRPTVTPVMLWEFGR